jgi:hypothetical protein
MDRSSWPAGQTGSLFFYGIVSTFDSDGPNYQALLKLKFINIDTM